jgi:hypothetical protein
MYDKIICSNAIAEVFIEVCKIPIVPVAIGAIFFTPVVYCRSILGKWLDF